MLALLVFSPSASVFFLFVCFLVWISGDGYDNGEIIERIIAPNHDGQGEITPSLNPSSISCVNKNINKNGNCAEKIANDNRAKCSSNEDNMGHWYVFVLFS